MKRFLTTILAIAVLALPGMAAADETDADRAAQEKGDVFVDRNGDGINDGRENRFQLRKKSPSDQKGSRFLQRRGRSAGSGNGRN
jgi:Ni/Co efflux regulator RcnB